MEKNIRSRLLLLILVLGSGVCANPIEYKDSRNSIMILNFVSTNKVIGKFASAVPIAKCKDVIGIPVPLNGIIDGNNISFNVKYFSCEAVIDFDGHINEKSNTIEFVVTQKFLFPNADTKGTTTHDVFIKVEKSVK